MKFHFILKPKSLWQRNYTFELKTNVSVRTNELHRAQEIKPNILSKVELVLPEAHTLVNIGASLL